MVPASSTNVPTLENPSPARIVFALIGLVLIGILGAYFGRSYIETAGLWLIDKYGLWGIAMATLITDTSPLPLTSEPVALLGLGAEIPFWHIILFMGGTSHLCGPLGYGFGALVGRVGLKHIVKRIPSLQPVIGYVRQHGVKAVAMGALLPIPYALTTWTAGALGVSFWGVCAASTLRWLKTLIYVSLLAGGWLIGNQ